MLKDIDELLHEHDNTQEQIAADHFADAMNSVRDLLDHGHERGHAANYCPTAPAIETALDIAERLRNVHLPVACAGRECVIHNPTAHHMASWPMLWRNDTSLFERVCACGVGHPDPDQFAYWKQVGLMYRSTHTCDGCCAP